MKSLYIHFPFCETKCHYCDFYSLAAHRVTPADHLSFENALEKEASLLKDQLDQNLDTLFFGGGTPSLTLLSTIEKTFRTLDIENKLTTQTEWTLESNPSSIEDENFSYYKKRGVNRISVGVQSLQNKILKKMDRAHDEKRAYQALDTVFKYFSNVSVDLLCGVPDQSLKDLEFNLDQLTSYPITHLSCYLLTLPPHHRMFKELPNEEEQISQLLFIHDYLEKKGFEHYEISNFCKPGFEARHNLHYWTGQSYLGLGPSAHSFDAEKKIRWKNISSLKKYEKLLLLEDKLPREWEESLNPEQLEIEKWMLALRLARGFPRAWVKSDDQKRKFEVFLEKKLLIPHLKNKDFYRLSPLGFTLSDQIIKELI